MNDDELGGFDLVEMHANHLKVGNHTIILSNVDVGAIVGSLRSSARHLKPDSDMLPVVRNILVRMSVIHPSFGPPERLS